MEPTDGHPVSRPDRGARRRTFGLIAGCVYVPRTPAGEQMSWVYVLSRRGRRRALRLSRRRDAANRSGSNDRQRLSAARLLRRRACSRWRSRSARTWRAIYEGEPAFLNRVGAPFERLLYRVCGVDPAARDALDRVRRRDAGVQRARPARRLRAAAAAGRGCRSTRRTSARSSPDSSFNTAVSFATNTNWQGYGGETTMSYLTQMLGARRCRTSSRPRPAWRCWSR